MRKPPLLAREKRGFTGLKSLEYLPLGLLNAMEQRIGISMHVSIDAE